MSHNVAQWQGNARAESAATGHRAEKAGAHVFLSTRPSLLPQAPNAIAL